MNEFQPIFFAIALGAVVVAVLFWRRSASLDARLAETGRDRDARTEEVSQLREEAQRLREEMEGAKRQARETKNKLERLKKERHEKRPAKGLAEPAPEAEAEGGAAAVVRVTQRTIEDEHRRRVEKLEAELATARAEADRLKKAETERAAAAQRAAERLGAPEADGEGSPEARIQAMATRLEEIERSSRAKEKELQKGLRKAQADARAAQKRAQSHHSLYMVIKGQLEVAEDRLALMRHKYEGARLPTQIQPAPVSDGASEAGGDPASPEVAPGIAADIPPEEGPSTASSSDPEARPEDADASEPADDGQDPNAAPPSSRGETATG